MDNTYHKINLRGMVSFLYFVIVGILVGSLCFIPGIITAILGRLSPVAMTLHYNIMQKFIFLYMLLIPFKIKTNLKTLSEVKSTNIIIISNHRSHLDMFLYLSLIPRLRAVARSNLFNFPIIGLFMWASRHFGLEKGNLPNFLKVEKEIRRAVHTKDRVLFFPEMTRAEAYFPGIQKFKLIPFKIARDENIPLLPIVLKGTDHIWPKGLKSMSLNNTISLSSLPLVYPNEFKTTKDLSDYIFNQMSEEFQTA